MLSTTQQWLPSQHNAAAFYTHTRCLSYSYSVGTCSYKVTFFVVNSPSRKFLFLLTIIDNWNSSSPLRHPLPLSSSEESEAISLPHPALPSLHIPLAPFPFCLLTLPLHIPLVPSVSVCLFVSHESIYYISMNVHVCVIVYIYNILYIFAYMYVCMSYMCIWLCVHVCLCMYVFSHVCTYV